jgi:ABC-2 type transport system ATP-binding protein
MPPIQIRNLSKRFGAVSAVDDLTFDVAAGRVTGFLGPNGAGKTTTLRALLGLVRPSSGSATFEGRTYGALAHPSGTVGAVLEDASFHPGRTARNHLRVLAAIGDHRAARVDEVLETVGLSEAADRRVKSYSLGMRQRLSIASALLGDPPILILDEPTNGLDPPGIAWVRDLMRREAADGRAVLVSSHVLAEVAQSVDDVVVVAHGQLRAAGPLQEVLGGDGGPATEVRAQEPVRLAEALERRGHRVDHDGDVLLVHGATPEEVGQVAGDERIAVLGLASQARSLETAFMALTGAHA